MNLIDCRMANGSRHFLAIPENVPWTVMRDHIAASPGAAITGYLTDRVTEVWIDFTYQGHSFTVNNQFGEFWFFVDDPNCPEKVLEELSAHCTKVRPL